jgi:riboflavin synthase
MFTGLVEEVGLLERLERRGPSARATIRCKLQQKSPFELGESVACSGVCLTVDRILEHGFEADVSSETLDKTTLGNKAGKPLNLERATQAGGRLGGHIVLGHVDDVARVVRREAKGDAVATFFSLAGALRPLVAQKGSITIDGVSLTINEVVDAASHVEVGVMLVPHTQGRTTLEALTVGARVNVEVDVLARYVARQLSIAVPAEKTHGATDQGLLEKLKGGGYI